MRTQILTRKKQRRAKTRDEKVSLGTPTPTKTNADLTQPRRGLGSEPLPPSSMHAVSGRRSPIESSRPMHVSSLWDFVSNFDACSAAEPSEIRAVVVPHLAIIATKADGRMYRHEFQRPVRFALMADGGLAISSADRRRLWGFARP